MTYYEISNGASAHVVVRMFKTSAVSEWFVALGGVPDVGRGSEITVNWLSLDIDNKNTFYTDSNGLEMQERILNFRPTWTWVGYEKITSNYYPIQSAIAIRDVEKNFQMTVMNSRSQGGSVIKNARVELMQQRRLYRDDGKGVGESLNEGLMEVPAQYFLQIFNYEKEPSL